MREIKFRVWYNKEWTFDYKQTMEVLSFHELLECGGDDKSDFNWMQYTGLKDKNGVDIYEGDIVRVFPKRLVTNGFIGEVKTSCDGTFVMGAVEENQMSNDWGLLSIFTIKIIGNIYENPNLLKGE